MLNTRDIGELKREMVISAEENILWLISLSVLTTYLQNNLLTSHEQPKRNLHHKYIFKQKVW